jgi:bacillithiol system protein YtxJ
MTIHSFDEAGGAAWPAVLGSSPLLVLYKHSPACLTSAVALTELRALHKTLPEVPVYQVDVIHERGLSQRIAADLQISHESPQVILICDGRPIWHTSHFGIKAAALVTQIARADRVCVPSPAGPPASGAGA